MGIVWELCGNCGGCGMTGTIVVRRIQSFSNFILCAHIMVRKVKLNIYEFVAYV